MSSTATGESMPATRVGAETMLSRIVHMVAEAQRSRAPIQRLADQVSSWFVPAVIAVAVVALLAWWAWGLSPASPPDVGPTALGGAIS